MNAFDDVISRMGVESSLYVRMQFGAPWGITFDTGYQARILVIARGTCWLTAEGMNPIPLKASDGLVIKAGTEFSMSDEIDRPRVPCSAVFSQIDGRTVRYGGHRTAGWMVFAPPLIPPSTRRALV